MWKIKTTKSTGGKLIFLFIIFLSSFYEYGRECIPYICFVSTEYFHVMVILRLRLSWLWCDGNIKRTWFVSVQRLTFIKERHQWRLYCAGIKKIFVLCPVLWIVFYFNFVYFSTTFFFKTISCNRIGKSQNCVWENVW